MEVNNYDSLFKNGVSCFENGASRWSEFASRKGAVFCPYFTGVYEVASRESLERVRYEFNAPARAVVSPISLLLSCAFRQLYGSGSGGLYPSYSRYNSPSVRQLPGSAPPEVHRVLAVCPSPNQMCSFVFVLLP
jgi:hypothetical protein